MRRTLFYILMLLWSFPVIGSPGKVIILYGTHCGGKTTVASELIKQLPGDFEYVTKEEIIEAKRKDYIEKVTGIRPQNRNQIFAQAAVLPPDQKKMALGFSSEAIRETLLLLKTRAQEGKNSIFAVCLSDLDRLELLNGVDYYKILVYAPLRDISHREFDRCAMKNAVSYDQQCRRVATLLNFIAIYQTLNRADEPFADHLSYEDIEEYIVDTREVGAHPDLEDAFQLALKHFRLKEGLTVQIAPKREPDLLINTGECTPPQCALLIKNRIFGNNQLLKNN